MREIFVASDNIITSLGFTTEENASALKEGQTGITMHEDERLSSSAFWASRVDDPALSFRFSAFANAEEFTRFEQLIICSVKDALRFSSIDLSDK